MWPQVPVQAVRGRSEATPTLSLPGQTVNPNKSPKGHQTSWLGSQARVQVPRGLSPPRIWALLGHLGILYRFSLLIFTAPFEGSPERL